MITKTQLVRFDHFIERGHGIKELRMLNRALEDAGFCNVRHRTPIRGNVLHCETKITLLAATGAFRGGSRQFGSMLERYLIKNRGDCAVELSSTVVEHPHQLRNVVGHGGGQNVEIGFHVKTMQTEVEDKGVKMVAGEGGVGPLESV